MNTTFANLENFGYREISEAINLMNAYVKHGTPDWFYEDGVSIEFNPSSGNVFLTNSEYQVLMANDDGTLYGWHYLGYHGYEGSAEDLYVEWSRGYIEIEDWEELASVLDMEGMAGEAEDVRRELDAEREGGAAHE